MDQRKKILIVDDEADIIEFLSYNFRKEGFEVMSAGDGDEGIKAAEEFNPDIIIADIMMPRMNGIIMCKILKSEEKFETLPFIFLSASGDEWHYISAMLAGAQQYIMKPIRFPFLLLHVNGLFRATTL